MKVHLCLIIAVLLIDGCEDMGIVSRDMEEADIKETMFRYQFFTDGSGLFNNGLVDEHVTFFALARADLHPIYWHSIAYFDLEKSFMSRFDNAQRPLRNYSQVRVQTGAVYDNATGQRGILFFAGPVRWVDGNRVEAEGGYTFGCLNAEGDIFFISRHSNQWAVDSVKYRWVS